MKKPLSAVAVCAAVCAVALPVASAGGMPNPKSQAQKQCRQELSSMGKAAFKATYGTNKNRSNAFGECVSHRTQSNKAAQQQAQQNASQQCRTERSQDMNAFNQRWGTPPKFRDAFGKCVSATAKHLAASTEKTEVKAENNAAHLCKAERNSIGASAFAQKYGTNHNKRNAFGKCVSQKAKELESGGGTSS
jgi:hypothetical protein